MKKLPIRKLTPPSGNGVYRLVIPHPYVEALGWKGGDGLQVSLVGNKIIVAKDAPIAAQSGKIKTAIGAGQTARLTEVADE